MIWLHTAWISSPDTCTSTPGASTGRSTEPSRRNAASSCCTVLRQLRRGQAGGRKGKVPRSQQATGAGAVKAAE